MKTNHKFFIGIDLSKLKIDVCIVNVNHPQSGKKAVFDNTEEGFKSMYDWLLYHKCQLKLCVFGMEHTGIYGVCLCNWLAKQNCSIVLEPARQIQHSIGGFHRGKQDQIDAFRIARYLYLHRDELTLYQVPSKLMVQIKYLLSYRDRLVKNKVILEVPSKEIAGFDPLTAQIMLESSAEVVSLLKQKIKEVNKQIKALIAIDESLQKNYDLLCSIIGIGPQTALYMLVFTKNFTVFTAARKFACYSGVAPFPHESGTSVKGKTRVSHLANQKMKELLNHAARSAVCCDNQLKFYYQRKRKEGKAHLTVLNAVRNKLVARAFAVIKRQSEYVELASFAA